jgi:regulator of sigma E protease
MTIIIFLIILAVLILVHEFGHFIVAKKSGIRVDEFGLGFPPKIFSKKWGSTLYTLNLLPFGGFVKIFGEDAHAADISPEDRAVSFVYKPKWIKASVLAAGVFMNIVFAWLLLSTGFISGLPAGTEYSGLGKVTNIHLTITEVMKDSAAEIAGLTSGDQIQKVVTSIGDVKENLTPENIRNIIQNSTGDVEITYKRGENSKTVSVSPKYDPESKGRIVGISMDEIGTLKLPVHLALLEGLRTTGLLFKQTVSGLAKFIWDSVRFKSDLSQVTGPIGIAHVVGEAKNLGFVYLITLVALISINLAVINLIPFPALDGGRLFFLLIEAITGREIPPKFVGWANLLGFILLITLMLVVTAHDILKFF